MGYHAMHVCVLSHFNRVWLCATHGLHVPLQAPLFMGFSRQEYWSGLPCPPPGDLPDPGTEPRSPTSPALVGRFFATSTTWEALLLHTQKRYTLRKPTSNSLLGCDRNHPYSLASLDQRIRSAWGLLGPCHLDASVPAGLHQSYSTQQSTSIIHWILTESLDLGSSAWGWGCSVYSRGCDSLLFSCKVVSSSFVTPWTVAYQAPLSMGFSRQEY